MHMWLGLLPQETFNTCKGKKWKKNKQKKEIEMKTKYLLRIEEKQRGQVQEIGHCKSQACYTWLASGVPYKKQICIEHLLIVHNVRNWESGLMSIRPNFATAF